MDSFLRILVVASLSFSMMVLSCSSSGNSGSYYGQNAVCDDSTEYDGEFVDEDLDEYYSDLTPITLYSSYFMLPAFNKFFSYDECSEWSVFFQPHGGMVVVTDSSGNQTVYEIYDSDFESTGDVLYKAQGENKYMRWWSDDSGMALFTGAPYSKDANAVVSYCFSDIETARKNLGLFPSWRTSGQDNYAESHSDYDSGSDYGSSSKGGSSSSSSSVCPDCGGKGYRPQLYTYSASNNSYYNTLGSVCPICGYKSEHYHYRCTTCKRF